MQTHIMHTGQKNLTQVRAFAHAANLLRWVQFSKWRPISKWHTAPGLGENGSESTNPAAAHSSSLCPPFFLILFNYCGLIYWTQFPSRCCIRSREENYKLLPLCTHSGG
ncbi:unnamed protein product, partial [Musa hybrid cultivar]